MTVFFAHLGSACGKAALKVLMKLTQGVNFINILLKLFYESALRSFSLLNRSTTANAPENDYMSDVASQSSRMYRTVSGQSLGDLESHQQEQSRQVGNKKESHEELKDNFWK